MQHNHLNLIKSGLVGIVVGSSTFLAGISRAGMSLYGTFNGSRGAQVVTYTWGTAPGALIGIGPEDIVSWAPMPPDTFDLRGQIEGMGALQDIQPSLQIGDSRSFDFYAQIPDNTLPVGIGYRPISIPDGYKGTLSYFGNDASRTNLISQFTLGNESLDFMFQEPGVNFFNLEVKPDVGVVPAPGAATLALIGLAGVGLNYIRTNGDWILVSNRTSKNIRTVIDIFLKPSALYFSFHGRVRDRN